MFWLKLCSIITLCGVIVVCLGLFRSRGYIYDQAREQYYVTKISEAMRLRPYCVKTFPEGACWTIEPPQSRPCQALGNKNSSFIMKNEVAFLFVPANSEKGIATFNEYNRFELKEGESFDIQTDGRVNVGNGYPCIEPEGMYGWYDPFVDSPFAQNVGGLEFAIDSLASKHYFAGKYYRGVAETDGVLVFRVIDRPGNYKNNSGGYTVMVRKRND